MGDIAAELFEAYKRHRGHEVVLYLPLRQTGKEPQAVWDGVAATVKEAAWQMWWAAFCEYDLSGDDNTDRLRASIRRDFEKMWAVKMEPNNG